MTFLRLLCIGIFITIPVTKTIDQVEKTILGSAATLLLVLLVDITRTFISLRIKESEVNNNKDLYIENKFHIPAQKKYYLEEDKELKKIDNAIKKKLYSKKTHIPEGILLYGPPGCGKNYNIDILAAMHNISIASFNFEDFYQNKIINQHEITARLIDFLKKNKDKKYIVFIDEIDFLLYSRNDKNKYMSKSEKQDLSFMLRFIENINKEPNVVFIAATNVDPSVLDPSIIRPGRINKLIEIKKPDIYKITNIIKDTLLENNSNTVDNQENAILLLSQYLYAQKKTTAECKLFIENIKDMKKTLEKIDAKHKMKKSYNDYNEEDTTDEDTTDE